MINVLTSHRPGFQDDLIARLTNNEIELPDAVVELASINRRKPLYPLWLTV
jgi:hypothetical protein